MHDPKALLDIGKRVLSDAALARFEAKTRRGANGCDEWQGRLDNGYGRFWLDGQSLLAHRVAWEITHGLIAEGLQIDHLCRNRACVNPAHLEPVTIATNVLRGTGITATNAAKTMCLKGHPFDDQNTRTRRNGQRACKECQRDRVRSWRSRNAVAEGAGR